MADITPPKIAITSNKTKLKAGDTALVTFTLSEPATDFNIADITVSGGTLGPLSGSGMVYSSTFTPAAGTASGSVSVGNFKFSDAAGNANEDGNEPDNRLDFSIDTVIPTITISSSKAIFAAGDTALISFKLSEPSTDFTLNDLVVSGGTLSNLSGSGANYTATFTPKSGVSTSGSISVGFNAFSDAAGNLNTQTGNLGFYVDTNTDPRLPTFGWVRLLGNSNPDYARALTTGQDGSIYISGNTTGALDGQTSSGGQDAFLTKYNPNGTKVWTRLLGTTGIDNANALTTGIDGSIYVSGSTNGALDGQTNNAGQDGFVTKYNPDGTKVWTRLLGSNSSTTANALTTGPDGSIYVGGSSYVIGGGPLIIGYGQDAFVTKYSSDGIKVWTRFLGTDSDDFATELVTGKDGSVFISGYTSGALDGQSNSGGQDAFVTKYNPDGTKVWTRLLGSSGSDAANALTLDADGSVYVGGRTTGQLFDGIQNISNSYYGGFITKYSTDGTKIWTKIVSGTQISAIKTGIDGAIYATGTSYGSAVDGQLSLGGSDSAVVRFETDGTQGWTRLFGSTSSDNSNALTVGADGSLFIAGETYADLYGEKNASIPLLPGKSGTASDAFLIKIGIPDTTPPKVSISASGASVIGPLKVGESVLLNFSLSESVSNFIASDITVQGGTLSNFQGAANTYTATYTAGFSSPVSSVSVGSGKFSDSVGNFNLDGADADNLVTFFVLTPEVTLITNTATVNEGSVASFNLSVTNVEAGTLIPYKISGVSPLDLINGSLDGYALVDAKGKATIALPIAADELFEGQEILTVTVLSKSSSIVINDNFIDNTPPTIKLLSDTGVLLAGQTRKITFYLSEPSTNFTASDVTIRGGTLSNWVSYGDTYTALFTPTANSIASGVISVASGVFTDAAGNANSDGADANNTVTMTVNTKASFIPDAIWTKVLGSSTYDSSPILTIGQDGSVYVSGGKLNNGSTDAFLTKYTADGTRQWTQLLGTPGEDYSSAMTTGQDGAIYISGSIGGALDGQTYAGSTDAFLTKFNADGTKAWTKLIGTNSIDRATAITVGTDGSIFVAGYTFGQLDGQTNLGSADGFLTKYMPDGTRLWTKFLGAVELDAPTALTTGLDGAIYITGGTTGVLDGTSNKGNFDVFLTKYSSEGVKSWTKQFGSEKEDMSLDMVTGIDGSIYIGGKTLGSFDGQINSGGYDSFLTKYNPDGTKIWTSFSGTSKDDHSFGLAFGIDGSIYMSGYTEADLDGQTPSGDTDGFLTKYNEYGTKIWTKLIGTNQEDKASGISAGKDGTIYITGYTEGAINGQAIKGADLFLIKYQDIKNYTGTFGDDIIFGSAGNDTLNGSSGFDTLYGLEGDDILNGGNGHDKLYGQNGDDTFLLGKGMDFVDGGSGVDIAKYDYNYETRYYSDGSLLSQWSIGKGNNEVWYVAYNYNGPIPAIAGYEFTVPGTDALSNIEIVQFTNISFSLKLDVNISSSKTKLTAGDTATLTFSLSEASTTFTASDVTVSGGTLSNFTGSGTAYAALFTPTPNSVTNGVVRVASGVFTDPSGNANADGADANNT